MKKPAAKKPVKAKATSKKPVKAKAKPKKPAKAKVAARKPAKAKVTARQLVKAKVSAKKPAKAKAAAKKLVKTKVAPRKPLKAKVAVKKPVTAKIVAEAKKPTSAKAAQPKKLMALPEALAAPKPSRNQYLLDQVLAQLEDAKATDVISINLEGKSAIADDMVVATGRSNRHVGAIADQLVQKLKAHGQRNIRVEGMEQCDWVLVDTGDIIVHLFRPEVRSFYNLEKLWSEHSPHETPAK